LLFLGFRCCCGSDVATTAAKAADKREEGLPGYHAFLVYKFSFGLQAFSRKMREFRPTRPKEMVNAHIFPFFFLAQKFNLKLMIENLFLFSFTICWPIKMYWPKMLFWLLFAFSLSPSLCVSVRPILIGLVYFVVYIQNVYVKLNN